MIIMRVPTWGFSCGKARYYGWHFSAHIGPWLLFAWQMPKEPEPILPDAQDFDAEEWARNAFPTAPGFGRTIKMVRADQHKEDL